VSGRVGEGLRVRARREVKLSPSIVSAKLRNGQVSDLSTLELDGELCEIDLTCFNAATSVCVIELGEDGAMGPSSDPPFVEDSEWWADVESDLILPPKSCCSRTTMMCEGGMADRAFWMSLSFDSCISLKGHSLFWNAGQDVFANS